jgi:hypothetical protein
MNRALVLIGVRRAGLLPELQAVAPALAAMREWAADQRIPPELVRVLSDEAGQPVRAGEIFDAVQAFCGLGTVEQLVVYFTGHGINKGYSEYWLLSGAPANPNEAVNVAGSTVQAERCGIPHVVFVSDACRTAPEGIQAQGVTGTIVFPNVSPVGPAASVDRFYACNLGDPAYEVRDPQESTRQFHAVYTDVLVAALRGRHGQLVEPGRDAAARFGFVRPWPLKRKLPELVSARLEQLNAPITLNQAPDAVVCSDPERHWLSRLELAAALVGAGAGAEAAGSEAPRRRAAARRAFRPAGRGAGRAAAAPPAAPAPGAGPGAGAGAGERGLRAELTGPGAPTAEQMAALRLRRGFGPLHFETGSGFKVRGEAIVAAGSRDAEVELLGERLVRVHHAAAPAANVLLRFSSGQGTVLPAIKEFLTSLTFEHGRLVDVTYEPADTTWRWSVYQERREELRELRAVIAASSRFGVFRLDVERPEVIARRMQLAKGVDPSLALYAAYGYSDLGQRQVIQEMQRYLSQDLGLRLFDVALLADDPAPPGVPVYPYYPMLARGWALLEAFRDRLPGRFHELHAHLVPSLWTLFDEAGMAVLSRSLMPQEVA